MINFCIIHIDLTINVHDMGQCKIKINLQWLAFFLVSIRHLKLIREKKAMLTRLKLSKIDYFCLCSRDKQKKNWWWQFNEMT